MISFFQLDLVDIPVYDVTNASRFVRFFIRSLGRCHLRLRMRLLTVLVLIWEQQGGAPPGQKPRSLMETLRPKLQVPTFQVMHFYYALII